MPSFASLRDFGNTSSASTWYTWSYIESTTGVKRGERVLQVWHTTSQRQWRPQ
jgi:3-ketoacyl-CoA synthase